jgi:hypothetical protein
MAHTSATTLEARRAALAVATALVAPTIASAAVITGMIAVMQGGAATSKNYSSYWTAVTLKESGKVVPIKRVVRARSDQLALTRSTTAPARVQIPSEFYAVTCGVENVPPAGLVCPADWRPFLVGLPAFEFDFSMARGSTDQHLGG